MACTYEYKNIKGTNLYEVLKKVRALHEEGLVPLQIDKLIFHRDSSLADITIGKIDALDEEYKNMKKNNPAAMGTLVTEELKTILSKNYASSTDPTVSFIRNYAPIFGTAIHEVILAIIEHNNEDKAIQKVIDVINDAKANSVSYDFAKLKRSLPWIDVDTSTQDFVLSIYDLVNTLLETTELKGKKLRFEKGIFCQTPGGKPINGRLDLLAVDTDGRITLIDFKTSKSNDLYKDKQSAYYAQTRLYQLMLVNRGVAREVDIDLAIGHITVLDGKLILGNTRSGGEAFDHFSSTGTRINVVRMKNEIDKELRLYFPLTVNVLNSQLQLERLEEIKKVQKTIFNDSFLKRDELDSFISFLDKLNEADTYRSKEDREIYNIYKLDENRYRLVNVKTGASKEVDKIQFAKTELLEIEKLQAETYNKFRLAFEARDPEKIKDLVNSSSNINGLKAAIMPFMSFEYDLIEDPVFANLGMLVFKNCIDKSISIVQLTSYSNLDRTYNLTYRGGEKKSLNILSNILTEKTLANYPQATMPAMVHKIMQIKALTALAMHKDVITKDGSLKIGKMCIVSTTSGNTNMLLESYEDLLNLFGIMADGTSSEDNLNASIFHNLSSTLRSFAYTSSEDRVYNTIHSILYLYFKDSGYEQMWNSIKSSKDTMLDVQTRIDILLGILNSLKTKYPEELNVTDIENTSVDTPIKKLAMHINELIVALRGALTSDSYNVSASGATLDSSLRAGFLFMSLGQVGQFTSDGDMVVGFLQGTETASPLAFPDKYMREIARVYTASFSRASFEAEERILEVNKATTKWLKSKESTLATLTLSDHRDLYALLFVKEDDGKVSPIMQFKNPFTDSGLTDADKEYLKVCLWTLYRVLRNDNTFTPEEKLKTYEEASKDINFITKFKNILVTKPSFLNIPLRTALDGTMLWETGKQLLKGNFKEAGKIWARKFKKWSSLVDPRGLTKEQENLKKEHAKAFLAYNMYTDIGNRINNIGGNPYKFEFNVNFLVNDFVYNVVLCDILQDVLNYSASIISVLKGIELMTGRDLSSQIKGIILYTNSAIFNSDNVDKKWEDLVKVVKGSRAILSTTAIALRPVLMVKELITGRFKNHLYASMGYFENEGITEKNMIKGEKIVFKDGILDGKVNRFAGHMEPGERTKVEALNYVMGIANVDVNIKSSKSTADRFGILNQQSDILYYTSTRPDYYNRMAIMIAKMDADGCWDAVKVNKDNKLVYNMAADKRYSIYWNNRNNEPKPEDSIYQKYLEQKARYLWAINEFNKDGFKNPDTQKSYKAGDALPLPYTNKETSSLKEVIGELYGFYNHEEKNIFLTQTYSLLFMAFKTYIPGEIRHYLKKADNNTSRGKVTWKTNEKGEKLYEMLDEKTGILKLTNKESHISESGEIIHHDPKYDWAPDCVEGLVNSTLHVIRDLFTEEGRLDLRLNKARRKRAEIFLLRGIIFGFLAALLKAIYSGFKEEDMQAVKTSYNIASKAALDVSFYHSLIEPIDDAGFVGVDMLQNLAKHFVETISDGDKGLQKLIYDSAAIKDLGFTV